MIINPVLAALNLIAVLWLLWCIARLGRAIEGLRPAAPPGPAPSPTPPATAAPSAPAEVPPATPLPRIGEPLLGPGGTYVGFGLNPHLPASPPPAPYAGRALVVVRVDDTGDEMALRPYRNGMWVDPHGQEAWKPDTQNPGRWFCLTDPTLRASEVERR